MVKIGAAELACNSDGGGTHRAVLLRALRPRHARFLVEPECESHPLFEDIRQHRGSLGELFSRRESSGGFTHNAEPRGIGQQA